MKATKSTTSLQTIKSWAERRNARPARLKDSLRRGGAVLRIRFPEDDESDLVDIPWDVWYDIFLQYRMEFFYEESTTEGSESNRFKLSVRGQ